jgi:hypothetical protein
MRYYFATRGDLLVFAVHHAGDRIEERVGRLPVGGAPLQRLRAYRGIERSPLMPGVPP